jgi:hypothetical protein
MSAQKSIKQKIIAALLHLAEPLRKNDAHIRKIERKRTLFLLEDTKPAIHLVITPETVVEEDMRGYELEFHAMFKIICDDARDPADLADGVAAFLQTAVESDPQLNGADGSGQSLASWVKYFGDTPFTQEELKPDGGILVTFLVRYRRLKGDPNTTY